MLTYYLKYTNIINVILIIQEIEKMIKYTFIRNTGTASEKDHAMIDAYYQSKWTEWQGTCQPDAWTVDEVRLEYEANGVELCLFHCENEEDQWLEVLCVKEKGWDITEAQVFIED